MIDCGAKLSAEEAECRNGILMRLAGPRRGEHASLEKEGRDHGFVVKKRGERFSGLTGKKRS